MKNYLTALLHSVLGTFMVRKVDSILGEMSAGIARLEKAVEQYDNLEAKHAAKATRHEMKAAQYGGEADRAARVAAKLKDLVK
jgi:hypothetical protein